LRRAGLIAAILSGALATPAQAAGPAPAPPTLEEGAPALATQRYLLGREAYKAGDLTAAEAAFRSAFDVFPTSARLAFNLARTLERQARLAEAATLYRRYLTLAPQAEDADTVARLADSLEQQVAARRPTLIVITRPAGADVRVDGVPLEGVTPLRSPVDAGTHLVQLHLADFAEVADSVTLAAGETTSLERDLVALPAATTPGVEPAPGVATTSPPVASPLRPVLGWSLAGTGVVGVLIGAVFHARALHTADDAQNLDATPEGRATWRRADDRFRSQRVGAFVGYGAGAALLATGLTLALWPAEGAP